MVFLKSLYILCKAQGLTHSRCLINIVERIMNGLVCGGPESSKLKTKIFNSRHLRVVVLSVVGNGIEFAITINQKSPRVYRESMSLM